MTAIDEDAPEPSPAATSEPTPLALRYGRTPAKRRRDRLIAVLAGGAAATVVVAWVIWAGLDQTGGTLETQDTGSTIVSDRSVSIHYQISAPVGTKVGCALQVQNEAHGIVGWRIVTLPESSRYTTSYTDTVRSSERGVTGLIYRCWVT